MTQAATWMIPANSTGTNARIIINDEVDAMATVHKGATPPPYADAAGFTWLDDSADPIWTMRVYLGGTVSDLANWPGMFAFNRTTGVWAPGGAIGASGASVLFQAGGNRFDTSGNLLMGTSTSSPGAGNGGVVFGSTAAGVVYLYRSTGTDMIRFHVNGNVVGNIATTTSSTSYGTSSDYRLKVNVELLDGAVDRVLALPVHRFNWAVDAAGPQVDGFLAHEAAEVVPEAVIGEKDAVDEAGNPVFQNIDQSKLVPVLWAAVQELAARVQALEA